MRLIDKLPEACARTAESRRSANDARRNAMPRAQKLGVAAGCCNAKLAEEWPQ